ncbi:protoporphyrinogen oxidase [Corynebacterium sp. 335C]
MTRPTTVAVLGAGLSGLVAAHRLRRRLGSHTRIVVADPAGRAGGKLSTADLGGPVDVGAEAWIGTKPEAAELVEELGLGDRVVGPSGLGSLIYSGGLRAMPRATLMGVPGSADALGDLVSEETGERIAAEGDPERTPPLHWVPGDDVNLGQLVAARMGQEVVDHVVSPLLGGVYSTLADDLGLRATVPQLAEELDAMVVDGVPVTLTGAVTRVLDRRREAMEAARKAAAEKAGAEGGGPRFAGIFRALDGGFGALVDALVEQSGAELLLGAETGPVEAVDGGLRVPGVGEVDGVVVAAPAPEASRLLASVAPDPAEIIGGVDLASSAVVALRLEDAGGLPENSGILVAADAGLDAKAFTFSSRKWPHLAERGGALVRASFGRYGDESLVELDDDELVRRAVRDLETATGFRAEPVETLVQRWRGGIPRYGVGHTELMTVADALLEEAADRGVVACGAWHHGPGIPACIADARAAADRLAAAL